MAEALSIPKINLNVTEAAELLGISKHTLNSWRVQGKGPEYVRMGKRILYPYSELVAFNDSKRVDPASHTVSPFRGRYAKQAKEAAAKEAEAKAATGANDAADAQAVTAGDVETTDAGNAGTQAAE